MGPILSPWPKLSGALMGYPYGPHVPAHMGPMWDMYGHVGWACAMMHRAVLVTRITYSE